MRTLIEIRTNAVIYVAAIRRARRGLTASRRLSGWEPAALITTRNRPIRHVEGTNEQPGS
jgi:hypothetical protein